MANFAVESSQTFVMGTGNKLSLEFDAEPGSVTLARAAVAELAQRLRMTNVGVGDVKTIVTEACTNVVRHAYPNRVGRFELEAWAAGKNLEIVVRDFGRGMSPRVQVGERSLGLGLGLISELSCHFEISGGDQKVGTEVRMRVPLTA